MFIDKLMMILIAFVALIHVSEPVFAAPAPVFAAPAPLPVAPVVEAVFDAPYPAPVVPEIVLAEEKPAEVYGPRKFSSIFD